MIKTVPIEIEVKSLKEVGKEMDEIAAKIKRGEPVKKTNRISVPSLDVARKIFSPERLKLLAVIEEKHPKSVYELARLLKRDRRNVTKDLEYLKSIGLVKIEKQRKAKTRKLTMPTVHFNKINIGIDLRRILPISTPT